MAKFLKPHINDAIKSVTSVGLESASVETSVTFTNRLYKTLAKAFIPEAELTDEQAALVMQKAIEETITDLKEHPATSVITRVLEVIPQVLAVAMGITSVASISNERNLVQPLRKRWRPTLLDPREIIEAEKRDMFDKLLPVDLLQRHGYDDESIGVLKALGKIIPTASDIVTWAVREVYSPEIAEKFGQYEGIEKVLKEAETDLKAAGLSEDFMTKYWAAHWILPSVGQGFEMLHRGVINEADLTMLMTALDIMPWWRDKLRDISFVPFTRVDARRMHKLGVLDEEGVKRAYLDIGYNEEKATKMTEFTIAYNADPEASEETALDKQVRENRDLTKTDLLRGYRFGLLTEAETRTMLTDLGYSYEETLFLLAREDYLKEDERTDKFIRYFHDAYLKGIWDRKILIEKLGGLALPSDYEEHLLSLWDLEKEVKVAVPTKAELLGFYKKGTISKEVCTEELKKQGYIDKYINWYLAGISKEGTET